MRWPGRSGFRWPWASRVVMLPEPKKKQTPLQVAADELRRREFPNESTVTQHMRGLGEERVKILRADGTWLAELVQGDHNILRVQFEEYVAPEIEAPEGKLQHMVRPSDG